MYLAKRFIAFIMDILETITFIGSIFIVIYLFIMQPNQVKGSSMVPTFSDQDFILTSKISYKFRTPQHGDVIVFRAPKTQTTENLDIEYIKRVIGVPGDQIMIKGEDVYVNNTKLEEHYIAENTNVWPDGFIHDGLPVVVPPDELFVMGDNRLHSSDSRQFGFIQEESIIGVVFYRYFPPTKMGFIQNPLKGQLKSSSLQDAYMYLARM